MSESLNIISLIKDINLIIKFSKLIKRSEGFLSDATFLLRFKVYN